jgi:hypothetical protein
MGGEYRVLLNSFVEMIQDLDIISIHNVSSLVTEKLTDKVLLDKFSYTVEKMGNQNTSKELKTAQCRQYVINTILSILLPRQN